MTKCSKKRPKPISPKAGVGRNLIKGGLLQGKEYYKKLYDILKNNKDKITIKIV